MISMTDYWLVNTDGSVEKTTLSNKDLLLKFPYGGFTTMKCYNYGNMFHLERHIERLRFTFNGVCKQNMDYVSVEKMVMAHLKNLESTCCGWEAWRITIVLYSLEDDPSKPLMLTHVMPIHDAFDCKSVTVDIVPGDRLHHGEMKSTYWVTERAPILAKRHEGSDEAFLLEKDGTVREGCLSNLFVYMKGKVYTAKDIIVNGTVRDVCIKAMEKANIPVVLENPSKKEIELWEECWYTSQTKGLFTINEIWFEGKVLKKFPEKFCKNVQKLTHEHVKNFWTKVWEKKE